MPVDAPRLERASRQYADSFLEMAREFHQAGDARFDEALENPDAHFEGAERFEVGRELPENRVRQSEFWLWSGPRLLGSSRLRHRLIPVLELDGGNIGYEIRPTERAKSYGSELLRLTLEEARQSGLRRVLLTTEPTNRPSIAVIERNGGVLADTSIFPNTGRQMLRYWIQL